MFFSVLKDVGTVARLQAQSDGTGCTIFPHLSLSGCIERLVNTFFTFTCKDNSVSVQSVGAWQKVTGEVMHFNGRFNVKWRIKVYQCSFILFRIFFITPLENVTQLHWICQINLLLWKLWCSWSNAMLLTWRWFVYLIAAQMIYSSDVMR